MRETHAAHLHRHLAVAEKMLNLLAGAKFRYGDEVANTGNTIALREVTLASSYS